MNKYSRYALFCLAISLVSACGLEIRFVANPIPEPKTLKLSAEKLAIITYDSEFLRPHFIALKHHLSSQLGENKVKIANSYNVRQGFEAERFNREDEKEKFPEATLILDIALKSQKTRKYTGREISARRAEFEFSLRKPTDSTVVWRGSFFMKNLTTDEATLFGVRGAQKLVAFFKDEKVL
jgi:hypothetical protein